MSIIRLKNITKVSEKSMKLILVSFFIFLMGCNTDNQKNDGLSNTTSKDSVTTNQSTGDSLVNNHSNDTLNIDEIITPDYPYPVQPSKENWQDDIGEVFVMLPDTFFLKNQNMSEKIGLHHKKRKQLVSGKKITIKQHCVVSFEQDDEFNQLNRKENFLTLNIFHRCIDGQGISYRLRPWETIEGEKIFGLFQLYGDWCCGHSNYWFLKPTKEGWEDVTEKVIGKITLYDFKGGNQSFPKDKDFKRFINDPYFYTDVQYFTDTIKLYLDFNLLGNEMNKEIYDSVYNQLDYELQLIWNGREFKKNLIQRADNDE